MKYLSYVGLLTVIVNTVYANLIDANVDKRYTLAFYFVGLVLAGAGKGLEKASKLNNKWATIIAVIAGTATAIIEIDPAVKDWLPANINTLLIIVAAVAATIGKSLFDIKPDGVIYADKDKPSGDGGKWVPILLLASALASQSACYVSDANTSNTRKLLLALNDAGHYTRLSLNTNMMLARTNVITPERALVFNTGLGKFNRSLQSFYSFLDTPGVLVFDDRGNATIKLSITERQTAATLLDAIAISAGNVLADEVLGGSQQRAQQYKPLIVALRELSRRITTAIATIRQSARVESITVPLLLDRAQWESMKGV